ncbi:L-idonate 5-dehydrogenase [Streptomyces odontomachi]|uniref:L-idonate 5-dehydrogenase n=1 Tax=Streptomyces odontomachi TaxID=2944940 RepID=UPI00210B43F6|nr:L-idonate 5-dehydrogenase [Streptomyces sp. ODS25]
MSSSVQAVVVHAAGDVRIEERPRPVPGPSEVLLAMSHGGICGSDLHYYRHGAVGAFTLAEPLTLGHEVVGTVAEDPSGRLAPGTAVAVHPGTSCGDCPECGRGLPQVCRDSRYLGSAAHRPHTQGGFTGQLAVPGDRLRVLPPELPLSRAVLVEPLAVGIHAVGRAGDVTGARVLVNGAGPIGILAGVAARAAGAGEVWAADLLDHPLRLAERTGADRTVRIGAGTLPEDFFDVVVEASGAPAGLASALAAVRRRGVIVQLGSLPGGPVNAPLASLVAKEVDLRGTFRFDTEIDDAIALLATTDGPEAVITHTFPMRDAAEALAVAGDPAASGKVVLRLDGS